VSDVNLTPRLTEPLSETDELLGVPFGQMLTMPLGVEVLDDDGLELGLELALEVGLEVGVALGLEVVLDEGLTLTPATNSTSTQ
jgi:hypothetical protein